jgi:hypothetical protein
MHIPADVLPISTERWRNSEKLRTLLRSETVPGVTKMNREEICLQLTSQIKHLIDKENNSGELLPDIRLLYGTQPGTRTPVMYQPGIVFSSLAIKLAISMSACSVMTPMNICS